MALSETKTYLVYNYNQSPVSVETKHDSHMIEGGTRDAPSTMPFSLDELQVINTKSNAFKIGLLWFDPEDEEKLYEALRIQNWKEILKDTQIEEILRSPTLDSLKSLLEIKNGAYFERVRGVFIGLRNAGADLSTRVANVIELRYKELMSGQRTTSIRLTPKAVSPEPAGATQEQVNALTAQLEAMKKMIAEMQGKTSDGDTPEPKQAEPSATTVPKPAVKRTNSKKQ